MQNASLVRAHAEFMPSHGALNGQTDGWFRKNCEPGDYFSPGSLDLQLLVYSVA